MTQLTKSEKLRRLIPHWIEHNQSHEAEFRRWAALAREAGEKQTAVLIENAAGLMQKAEAELAAALKNAGGAVETCGPDDDHHHGA